MKISIIVAHGVNNEIGLCNKLLWYIPEDFKYFKETTNKHFVLMGSKTFKSIGKPLPNRTSIVISNTYKSEHENVYVYNDIIQAIEFAKQCGETELFVIGGGDIYKQLLPYCTNLYISNVNYSGKADTYFCDIDYSQWELYYCKHFKEEVNIPKWELHKYRRKLLKN